MPSPSRSCREGDQRDPEGAGDEQSDVCDRDEGDGQRGEALGQVADHLDAFAGQVEVERGRDADDDGHEDCWQARHCLLEDLHDDEGDDADAERPEVGGASEDLLDGRDDLAEQPVSLDREAAQLADLADEDGEGQAVHVADHGRLGQQVGDEAQLGRPGGDHEDADKDRLDRGQHHGPDGVAARGEQRQDRRRDHRAE
jgi:hypothetical protein